MIRGANQVVPPFMPIARWARWSPTSMLSAQSLMSQAQAISQPCPSAQPLINATTGFFSSRSETRKGWWTVIEESIPGVGSMP